jgi:hypothetical protein
MRQGWRIARATVAAAVVAMLLAVAGQARAQTSAVEALSGQVGAAQALGAQVHEVTASVETAPAVAGATRALGAQAHQVTAAVESPPAVAGATGALGAHAQRVSAIVEAAPVAGQIVHRGNGDVAGIVRVGSSDRFGGSAHDGMTQMTGGASRVEGGGPPHDLGQLIPSTRRTVTRVIATVGDRGRVDPAGAATLAGATIPRLVGVSTGLPRLIGSASASLHGLIGVSASLFAPLTGIVRAALSSVPALLGPQSVGLVGVVWALIGSEAGQLSSQLVQAAPAALSPGWPLLQELPGAVLAVRGGTVGRSSAAPVPVPTFSRLQGFSAPSVAPHGGHADRTAHLGLGAAGASYQRFALGAGNRGGAAVAPGLRSPLERPDGNGALSFSGPFHAGVGLPLMLLALTLLIPASWRRRRMAAARYRPVIFASPLERPG